jgi:hypothetical protein
MRGKATTSEFDHSRDFRPEAGKIRQQAAVDAANARRRLGTSERQRRERRVKVPAPQPEPEPEPEPEHEKPATHTAEIERILKRDGWEWSLHGGRYYYYNNKTQQKQWGIPYLGPTSAFGPGVVQWDENQNTYIIDYPDDLGQPEVVPNYGLNWPAMKPMPRLAKGGGNKQSGKNRKRTNRKRTNRKRTNRKRTNRKRTNRKRNNRKRTNRKRTNRKHIRTRRTRR